MPEDKKMITVDEADYKAALAKCVSQVTQIEQLKAQLHDATEALTVIKAKMDAAEKAMVAKDYVRARQLAEQAQVDAQLAGAMARSAKAKKAADELQEGSRILRQEIERKAN